MWETCRLNQKATQIANHLVYLIASKRNPSSLRLVLGEWAKGHPEGRLPCSVCHKDAEGLWWSTKQTWKPHVIVFEGAHSHQKSHSSLSNSLSCKPLFTFLLVARVSNGIQWMIWSTELAECQTRLKMLIPKDRLMNLMPYAKKPCTSGVQACDCEEPASESEASSSSGAAFKSLVKQQTHSVTTFCLSFERQDDFQYLSVESFLFPMDMSHVIYFLLKWESWASRLRRLPRTASAR